MSDVGADEYEQKYMGGGAIAYQSKAKAPRAFHALLLGVLLLSAAIVGTAAALTPGASPLLMFAVLPTLLILLPIWLLFAVLRATVTSTHVHIQYGLFGPKIPIESVESCESVSYDWKQYGGWGIRRGRDGSWAYNMMGDQGRAVKLVWRDEKGNATTTLLSASDPEAFVRAVQKVRAKAAPPAIRIETKERGRPEPTAAELAEAEKEMEADLEASRVEASAEKTRTAD